MRTSFSGSIGRRKPLSGDPGFPASKHRGPANGHRPHTSIGGKQLPIQVLFDSRVLAGSIAFATALASQGFIHLAIAVIALGAVTSMFSGKLR